MRAFKISLIFLVPELISTPIIKCHKFLLSTAKTNMHNLLLLVFSKSMFCQREIFAALRPRSFSFDVVVRDPLFIISHHPLQKWVEFVPFQQCIAGVDSVREIFLRQLVWHPNIQLFLESNLLQMVIEPSNR